MNGDKRDLPVVEDGNADGSQWEKEQLWLQKREDYRKQGNLFQTPGKRSYFTNPYDKAPTQEELDECWHGHQAASAAIRWSKRKPEERRPVAATVTKLTQPSTPHSARGYVTPHVQLMLDAIVDNKITADSFEAKKILIEYFEKKTLPDGKPLSKAQIEYMATFCRPPEATKGGNKPRKG